jgi:foldase protein PrsA
MPKQKVQPVKKAAFKLRRRPPRKPDQDENSPDKAKKKRRNTLIAVVSIFVVICLVIGVGYYLVYVMPFQRPIIKVDNDVIKINYLLKRAMNSSSDDPIGGLFETLVNEIIVRDEAPKYGINVTDQDIDQTLRDAAKGDSDSITDAEFNEWYRQILNTTQYTDKQFRDIVKRSIEQQRLAQYFADNTPTTAEQGHIWIIVVKTYDEAVAAKDRLDNGEEFASVAMELSLDSNTAENGGDMGWIPFKALESRFEYAVSGLEIGKCSDPVINDPGDQTNPDTMTYAVLMVSEKEDREVSGDYLTALQNRAYTDWLNSQWADRDIKYYGIHGGNYDDVTSAWLNYQLSRLKASTTSTPTPTPDTGSSATGP